MIMKLIIFVRLVLQVVVYCNQFKSRKKNILFEGLWYLVKVSTKCVYCFFPRFVYRRLVYTWK